VQVSIKSPAANAAISAVSPMPTSADAQRMHLDC
jgi:hypothetical protein